MKRVLFPLLLLLGAPLASMRQASACSSLNCQPPVRVFQAESHVPANLIRFKVTVADPGPLELRAADGTVVPGRISMLGTDRVFGPDAPPAVGQRLTLHYRPVCLSPTPYTEGTFSFFVAEAADLNLGPSELTMTEKGIGFAGNGRTMIVRFHHRLPGSASALHLTDTTWSIAGRPLATYWQPGVVFSYCTPPKTEWQPDTCGTYGTIPPGKHLLKAVTRIVGIEQEFVADLEVDTSCEQVLRIDPSVPPGSGPNPDTGSCSVSALGGTSRGQLAGGSLALLLVALGWVGRRSRRLRA